MKFKKEELSAAVKAELTKNGEGLSMSERTLNEMVSNHYTFATEETELNDFVTKILPSYESVRGQLRHDISESIENWKKAHPENKNGNDGEGNQQNGLKTEDEVTARLLARIEALENEAKAKKTAETLATKRASIKEKAIEKGVGSEEWLNNYLPSLAITEESDVEKMAENALNLFNMGNAKVEPNVQPGSAGGGTTNPNDEYADIVAKRKTN